MRFLLDTHVLIWTAIRPQRLPPQTRILLEDPDNELIFSVVNIWEIAIKFGLGREDFRLDPGALRRGLVAKAYTEVLVTSAHAIAVIDLPLIHRDPFDRLLLAQAIVEEAILLTIDPIFEKYPGPIRMARSTDYD